MGAFAWQTCRCELLSRASVVRIEGAFRRPRREPPAAVSTDRQFTGNHQWPEHCFNKCSWTGLSPQACCTGSAGLQQALLQNGSRTCWGSPLCETGFAVVFGPRTGGRKRLACMIQSSSQINGQLLFFQKSDCGLARLVHACLLQCLFRCCLSKGSNCVMIQIGAYSTLPASVQRALGLYGCARELDNWWNLAVWCDPLRSSSLNFHPTEACLSTLAGRICHTKTNVALTHEAHATWLDHQSLWNRRSCFLGGTGHKGFSVLLSGVVSIRCLDWWRRATLRQCPQAVNCAKVQC